MGNRKLPFGYHMELGKIVPHPPEAVLVKHVFQAYIAGESYNSLVEWLREQMIPYDVGRVWNKNMVARILSYSSASIALYCTEAMEWISS